MTPLLLVLLLIGVLVGSALMSVAISRSDRAALWVGTVSCIAACLAGGGLSARQLQKAK
jgi:hypothetical protein